MEEAENRQFLVMELVDGATHAERIEQGSLPFKEALPLFIQIAEGLEAAHETGAPAQLTMSPPTGSDC